MIHPILMQEVQGLIRCHFKRFRAIQAAYLFGSILTDAFTKNSDVDVLFIISNVSDRNNFLKEIRHARSKIRTFKLDINIVFDSEFEKRWHIYRPPTFYMWIKQKNILLWGRDRLQAFNKEEVTSESIYRRAVDLAQSSRSIYLNDKNAKFWEEKYVKWLRELTREILYVMGRREANLDICASEIAKIAPRLRQVSLLKRSKLSIKRISEISEALAQLASRKVN